MDFDLTGLHRLKAANGTQYGGFTATRWAQEAGNIPFRKLKTKAIDNPNDARAFLFRKLDRNVFEGNQGWIGIHPYNFRIESQKIIKTPQLIYLFDPLPH